MNAASRILVQNRPFSGGLFVDLTSKRSLMSLALFTLLFFSSIGVIYLKNIKRHYYNELQLAQNQRNELKIQWGQLLLEQSTWGSQARVRQIAQQKIGMVSATNRDTVIIRA